VIDDTVGTSTANHFTPIVVMRDRGEFMTMPFTMIDVAKVLRHGLLFLSTMAHMVLQIDTCLREGWDHLIVGNESAISRRVERRPCEASGVIGILCVVCVSHDAVALEFA